MSKNKFAKEQLTKHGWKEGSGLGKDETGIKDAIKVKIKHDTAGVGHNRGDEFTYQWWDHVFNKAASSISVKTNEDGVAVEKIADNGPVSNKKTKTYDSKAMLYGQFVKGATLSNGLEDHLNEDDDSSSEDDEETIRLNRLMEDSMVTFCEGMTGHKAARHGHRLSGKMARVMEQEKQQLEMMKRSKQGQDRKRSSNEMDSANVDSSEKGSAKRKKKKKNKGDNKDNSDDNLCNETNPEEDGSLKKAKKKKKQKSDENLLIDSYREAVSCDNMEVQDDTVCTVDVSSSEKRKKKSKKKKRKREQLEESVDINSDESLKYKRKNKIK